MAKKQPVRAGGLRVRAFPILEDAIEGGVEYGWFRAHKHTDAPSEIAIKEAIYQAVLNAICDRFEFDEDRDDE